MPVRPIEVAAEMTALTADDRDIGAVVSFTGLVREMTEAGAIQTMELEHYPGMTERALEEMNAGLDWLNARLNENEPSEEIKRRARAFEALASARLEDWTGMPPSSS